MMNKLIAVISLLIPAVLQVVPCHAQPEGEASYRYRQWDAEWITPPATDTQAYGVYLFRKEISLPALPTALRVHVSADNRYQLYVNDRQVGMGPIRGDIEHWNYETLDLAPYLKPGTNVVSARVWNEGPEKMAEAQVSLQTAFILQGLSDEGKVLNTDKTWLCVRDSSYSIPVGQRSFGYSVVPPTEQIDMRHHIRRWYDTGYDTTGWRNARTLGKGTPKQTIGIDIGKVWRLVPSPIPSPELKPERLAEVRKAEGVKIPKGFPAQAADIVVPPNTKASILLDNRVLTNAYPLIRFSGGQGDTIRLTFGESLYKGFAKGNRNEVEGKTMIGRTDQVISDGTPNQEFTTLSYRTYRYVIISVNTGSRPLTIHDFSATFTGYPFQLKARLDSDDKELQQILTIGWRTARLCAVETYMDCPFYEQLQYIGDGRIQALVSLFNAGDDRLVKNMITLADNSRQPEGITLSRYPTRNPQIIPTFTLWYIGMLHDYLMYGSDPDFIKDKLPAERQIMGYFGRLQAADGSLKNLPNWAYVDWTFGKGWMRGMSPVGADGYSAVLDLQLLLAYQYAAQLETHGGMNDYVTLYRAKADQLAATIRAKYWNSERRLFADTSARDSFSQHANSLAILAGLLTPDEAKAVGRTLLTDTTLVPASIYFRYYLHAALIRAGLGNEYLSWLDVWRKNIELGLTTWAETSQVESARSDCHAWGSSPNIEFFRTLLGIDSAAPNFRQVRIAPHLGDIKKIGGEMALPAGNLSVQYERRGADGLRATLVLPQGVTGTFVWNGQTHTLTSGTNQLNL
jgi:hypothetical protein